MPATHDQKLDIFAAGSVQLDLRAQPLPNAVGDIRPASVCMSLGGTPVHFVRTFGRGKYRTAIFGAQHTSLHKWVADEIAKLGATALLRPRTDALGASIILPDETDGGQILVQPANLRYEDLDDEAIGLLSRAHLTIAGPMAVESNDGDTPGLLRAIGRLSDDSVLLPHPTLISHPAFAEIARLYACVILNAEEAAILSPEQPGVVFSALKLRRLLGERSEFLITNGCGQGLQYAGGNWRHINPHKIGECPDDVGAGDTFAAFYAEGRYLRGLESGLALERALAGVALYLQARNRGVECSINTNALRRKTATRRKATHASAPMLGHHRLHSSV